MSQQSIGFRDPRVTRRQPKPSRPKRRISMKGAAAALESWAQIGEFPESKMPTAGWRKKETMRGNVRASQAAHRASTRVLASAYPFLAESGEIMRGAYIGENLLSRSPFCFDPWEAYTAGILQSHSIVAAGVKGSGKSMLGKSFATRLTRLGRCVAVPHDPNGEWVEVANYVGGKVIKVGLGLGVRINLLDSGARNMSMSRQAWREHVMQDRRAVVKGVVMQLRSGQGITEFEHTAIDDVIEGLMHQDEATVGHVYESMASYDTGDTSVRAAAHGLTHVLRRLVRGDLAGMFDGPSTVRFDSDAPMMVVDTAGLRGAAPDMQALARMATTRWVRSASTGRQERSRLIVHEEAAVALMNDVFSGVGLVGRVNDEKVARHDGTASMYLIHGISDLDALGDAGSAVREQAMRILNGCETRISYLQPPGDLERSARALGWNETMRSLVPKLKKGEGLWQIGQSRIAHVRNKLTPREFEVFNTDGAGVGR